MSNFCFICEKFAVGAMSFMVDVQYLYDDVWLAVHAQTSCILCLILLIWSIVGETQYDEVMLFPQCECYTCARAIHRVPLSYQATRPSCLFGDHLSKAVCIVVLVSVHGSDHVFHCNEM